MKRTNRCITASSSEPVIAISTGNFSMRSGPWSVTVKITILLIRQNSLWNQRHAVDRYCRPSENVSRRFSWNYLAAITVVANKTDLRLTYSKNICRDFSVYYPTTIRGLSVICEVCRPHVPTGRLQMTNMKFKTPMYEIRRCRVQASANRKQPNSLCDRCHMWNIANLCILMWRWFEVNCFHSPESIGIISPFSVVFIAVAVTWHRTS